jgi:hypothetical protein
MFACFVTRLLPLCYFFFTLPGFLFTGLLPLEVIVEDEMEIIDVILREFLSLFYIGTVTLLIETIHIERKLNG